jgi:uncharacterized membrane protein YcaP (DUF421 family)
MKAEEIKLDDWQRILFGNTSPEFLIEVFIRTLIIYVALLLAVKWLGKRMSGQLTIIEMTVMITLGAIVSVPMQMPDRGLLQGLLILITALLLHRGITHLGHRSPKAEDIIQGKPTVIVKNGVLQLGEMSAARVSKQQLFSELRSKKIFHLGKVRRVYLEPSGAFSILLAQEAHQGLPLYPPSDRDIFKGFKADYKQSLVCINCGMMSDKEDAEQCEGCHEHKFIKAIA